MKMRGENVRPGVPTLIICYGSLGLLAATAGWLAYVIKGHRIAEVAVASVAILGGAVFGLFLTLGKRFGLTTGIK